MEEISEFLEVQEQEKVEDVNTSDDQSVESDQLAEGMRITLISHFAKEQMNGLPVLRKWMEAKGFMLESFEYKVLEKREIKRPINPKNPNGPQEKVVIDEKVNLSTDFKNLRQLVTRLGKEPQNLLVVQQERAKGEYFCINLLFKNILKSGRPILVTHLPPVVKAQILSIPDLQFVSIPKGVEENEELKKQLLDRAKRTRGMQSTMRELAGMPFFPGKIINKISSLAAGQKTELTDAESINLLLMADLHNRYSAMLQSFEMDVKTQKVAVPALTYVFNELMQDVSFPVLMKRFDDYLADYEGVKFTSKAQLFAYLYSIIPKFDEKKASRSEGELSVSDMFRRLRSLFINSRSQYDPATWKRCIFLNLDMENLQESLKENEPALEQLAAIMKKLIEGYQAATSSDLGDVWSVHTSYKQIFGRDVKLQLDHLDKLDASLVNHIHSPWFNLAKPKEEHKQMLEVFKGSEEKEPWKLYKSVHLNARALGVIVASQLEKGVQHFLEPGLQNLIERYGINFFDILYETVVKGRGLPLSRNQTAKWLQDRKLIGTVKNRGWIPNDLEKDYDKNFSQKILNFSGESALPIVYTQDDFEEQYQSSRSDLVDLLASIESANVGGFQNSLVQWREEGVFFPMFSSFTKQMQASPVFALLQKMIRFVADPLMDQISSAAVNQKLVLKIPLAFEHLLLIGHTFDLEYGAANIKLHLLAIPVVGSEKMKGLTKHFSEGLESAVEGSFKDADKLLEVAGFLSQIAQHKFYPLSRLAFMDRLLKALRDEREGKKRLLPKHFKYYVKDKQKLVVGNPRGLNLGGIYAYETGKNQAKAEDLEAISFGQLVEALEMITSVSVRVKTIREDAVKVLTLLNKFAGKIKETDEWKQCALMIKNFVLLVSCPPDELVDSKLMKLQDLADKLRVMFLKSKERGGGVIYRLMGIWAKRFPGYQRGLYFFLPFAENQGKQRDDLVVVIRKSRIHMTRMKMVRVIIFFPEGAKKFHINHLISFEEAVKRLPFHVEMFIETSSISREQVNELCRVYHPQQLFRVSRLEPMARPS